MKSRPIFNLASKFKAWRARREKRRLEAAARLLVSVSNAKRERSIAETTARLKRELGRA